MRPFKPGLTLANWLLRIAIIGFMYLIYLDVFLTFDFRFFGFYIAALFLIFSLLLFLGGFAAKHTLTVLSGFIIFVLSIFRFIQLFEGTISEGVIIYFVTGSIGFYFLSNGNKY